MDTPKTTAARIRQILAAMERSIDTARSRRVSTPGTAAIPVEPATSSAAAHAAGLRTGPTSAPTLANRSNQVIGASTPVITAPVGTPVPPGNAGSSQPPRLKARPKRFEGALPAPFSQPAYRSQTG